MLVLHLVQIVPKPAWYKPVTVVILLSGNLTLESDTSLSIIEACINVLIIEPSYLASLALTEEQSIGLIIGRVFEGYFGLSEEMALSLLGEGALHDQG